MPLRFKTHSLLAAALLLPTSAAMGQTQIQSDWVTAVSGDWFDAANWSSADFPDNAGFTFYDVLIGATGSPYTVSLSNFNIDVDSLTLDSADATLSLFSTSTLDVNTIDLRNGTLFIVSGRIEDATITATNGRIEGKFREGVYLEDVTFASDLEVDVTFLYLTNGLTLANDAVIDIARPPGNSGSNLTLEGVDPAIAGNGTLRFQDAYNFWVDSGNRGFFEAGVTLIADTGSMTFGGTSINNPAGRWVNHGTMQAMGSGANIHIREGNDLFQNTGLVEGFNDAYLQFESNWENLGTIRLHDTAYLELGGTFSMSDIGTIESLDDATVSINGILALQPGDVFEIDGSIHGLELNGATLQGGRILGVDENNFDRVTTATLDGTAIESLDLTGSVWFIRNGLELDNASLQVDGGFSHLQSYQFVGPQTISGNGRLGTVNGTEFRFSGGHTVFGPGIVIDATNGSADLGVSSNGSWENQGTIHVGNGWSVDFLDDWTNTGNVILDDGAVLLITGDFQTSDLGMLTGSSNAFVRFHHNTDWDNTGQTIDFSAIFGELSITSSRIFGGTLTTSQPFDFEPNMFLSNVTVDFDWDMRAHPNRGPVIEGDLAIAFGRTITLSTNGQLRWDGAQPYTLSGDGAVIVTGDEAMEVGGDGLVIGAGVTLQNGDAFGAGPDLELKFQTNHGTIFQNAATRTLSFDGSGQDNHGTIRATIGTLRADTLTNAGLVEANDANARIDLLGTTTNSGTLRASNGGVLEFDQLTNTGQLEIMTGGQATIAGVWDNTGGTIHVDHGRLILGTAPTSPGTFTQDQAAIRLGYDLHVSELSQIPQAAGSTIEIAGTIDLTGSGLAMDQHPAQFVLVGGRIEGNRQINGDTPLWAAPSDDGRPSVLDDVALLSDLGLIDGANVNLVGPMTLSEIRMFGDGRVRAMGGSVVQWQRAELDTTLELMPGSEFRIFGTFDLDGEIRTGGSTGSSVLRFGVGPITGTGSIVMRRAVEWELQGPLTLGSQIDTRFEGSDAAISGGDVAFVNNGTLDILAGSQVQATVSNFTSNGRLQVTGGSELNVNASSFVVSNDLILDGTVGSSGSDIHIIGDGALIGMGMIDLAQTHRLVVEGTLRSSSAGTGLVVDGSLLIELGGRFEANPLSSAALLLDVSGEAQLGGTLELDTDSLNAITVQDEIVLIQAGSLDGTFDQVTGLGIDNLLNWSIRYDSNTVVAIASLTGDADGDLLVNGQDLDIVFANWGTAVTAGDRTLGDLDGNGLVSQSDLELVIAAWGSNLQPESSVPEPGSLSLLVGLGLLMTRPRRRRSSQRIQA